MVGSLVLAIAFTGNQMLIHFKTAAKNQMECLLLITFRCTILVKFVHNREKCYLIVKMKYVKHANTTWIINVKVVYREI